MYHSPQEANKYLKNVEKKFGPVQLPSASDIRPIFGKLETEHVDDMFPGYRNPQMRACQNASDQWLQIGEAFQVNSMDDVRPIETRNCEHKSSTSSNAPPCFPINKQLISQLQLCLQSMHEMKTENESQRAEIIQLRAENAHLKHELAQSKRRE